MEQDLKKKYLQLQYVGKNIYEVTNLSVNERIEFINNINLSEKDRIIAHQILKEINERL